MSDPDPGPTGDRYPLQGPLRFESVIEVRTSPLLMLHHPGRNHVDGQGRRWARDLTADLEALRSWGAACVVTLVEAEESGRLGVPDYFGAVRAAGFTSLHLPIPDMSVPGVAFMNAFTPVRSELDRIFDSGAPVAMHCASGLGRTGTLAAALLIHEGHAPFEAMARVRVARPGAIETRQQEAFLERCLSLWE